jgi:glucosamine--fructose-6-phosphate aminotransferase (isomerizing)
MTAGLDTGLPCAPAPGSTMRREMSEQSEVLGRLVARASADREQLRSSIPHSPVGIRLVARGSSWNAANLGRYLIEHTAHRPTSLAAPAVHTVYNFDVNHEGYVAIGLSQSGATPEIATVLSTMRRSGARTVAVTNAPDSVVADAAEVVYALDAGDELAVPATKTATAQMLGLVVIASVFGPTGISPDQLRAFPSLVAEAVPSMSAAQQLAARWAATLSRIVVVSRGYGYAAALEVALKITETAGIPAQAFSAADLLHGPIASIGPDSAVLIIDAAGSGSGERGLSEIDTIATARGAPVAWCSALVGSDLPLPSGCPEPLAAIIATIRGQQLALALALIRGMDPDAPPGLTKVTRTY